MQAAAPLRQSAGRSCEAGVQRLRGAPGGCFRGTEGTAAPRLRWSAGLCACAGTGLLSFSRHAVRPCPLGGLPGALAVSCRGLPWTVAARAGDRAARLHWLAPVWCVRTGRVCRAAERRPAGCGQGRVSGSAAWQKKGLTKLSVLCSEWGCHLLRVAPCAAGKDSTNAYATAFRK